MHFENEILCHLNKVIKRVLNFFFARTVELEELTIKLIELAQCSINVKA